MTRRPGVQILLLVTTSFAVGWGGGYLWAGGPWWSPDPGDARGLFEAYHPRRSSFISSGGWA